MSSEPMIFSVIARTISPTVIVFIIAITGLLARTYENRNWLVLSSGWIINLLYVYSERITPKAPILGLPENAITAGIASVLTGMAFLAFYLLMERAKPIRRSLLSGVVVLLTSVIFVVGARRLRTPPPEIFWHLPIVVFSVISIGLCGKALWNDLGQRGYKSRLHVAGPYIIYAGIQPAYLSRFTSYPLLIMVAFGCALVIKIWLATGLYMLFREQSRRFDTTAAERQERQVQLLAFSWFAHELKQPIFGLKATADTIIRLVHQRRWEKVLSQTSVLSKQARVLTSVVESVKLAAEPFDESKCTVFSLNEALDDALDLVRTQRVMPPPSRIVKTYSQHLLVFAVRENLVQVFSNVLRNAAEAAESALDTEDVAVRISLKTWKESESVATWVVARISDFGPGIPRDIIENIFQPYYSSKHGINRGLGLWVVRNFVERFGGKVAVKSPIPGFAGGTQFDIKLPEYIGMQSARGQRNNTATGRLASV